MDKLIEEYYRAASAGDISTLGRRDLINLGWNKKNTRMCELAAKGNHFETVKWLKANGWKLCPNLIDLALENCNLEMAKWAYKKRCDFGDYSPKIVGKTGSIECAAWVMKKLSSEDRDCRYMLCGAASRNHRELCEWILDNSDLETQDSSCDGALTKAAKHGHLELLKWMMEDLKMIPDDNAGREAAEWGHLEVVQYLIKNNGADPPTCVKAFLNERYFTYAQIIIDHMKTLEKDRLFDP